VLGSRERCRELASLADIVPLEALDELDRLPEVVGGAGIG
jgi:hypothetical protein